MKTCPKCSKEKSLLEFYQRKRGPRAGQYYEKCKSCMKVRGRNYYHDNHDRQLQLALKRRHSAYIEKRKFINKIKDVPCADCGHKYPYFVMDFDHIDTKNKVKEVGYMMTRNWSLDKIKEEITKCEIVCANCHRIRTYSRILNQAEIA